MAQFRGGVRMRDAMTIGLDRIAPDPGQPRKEFDPEAIDRLARSLATRGQLMPIRVRWDAIKEQYIIIAGERRYRAAVRAGLAALQCVVAAGGLSEREILQEQLVENCLREDLRPLEQAHALRALMEANGWSAQQVAEELHLSKTAVIKAVSLLRLPESVQELVNAGRIAPSIAYELSQLERPGDQIALAERIAAAGLTRTEVAGMVKAQIAGRPAALATPTATATATATARAARGPVRGREPRHALRPGRRRGSRRHGRSPATGGQAPDRRGPRRGRLTWGSKTA